MIPYMHTTQQQQKKTRIFHEEKSHLVEVAVGGEKAHHPARHELADVGHEPPQLVQLLLRTAAVEREVESLSRGSSLVGHTAWH